jgi:xanthine dehydrogenase accessory factor
MRTTILILGSNDIGSAAAHRLFCAEYSVIIRDDPMPGVSRRGMAFTDALFEGLCVLNEIEARRASDLESIQRQWMERRSIPITALEPARLIESIHPAVIVDARMRKHHQPESIRGLAPLTIGLGPNFTCQDHVDIGIETGWGESLGRVIRHGSTAPLSGEPRSIDGHGRDRYVYAPQAGIFRTERQIGDAVVENDPVAMIEAVVLRAPIRGVLRGLTHDGAAVDLRAKVIEIDPRGERELVFGIHERAAKIAQGVLQAVRQGTIGGESKS